MSVNTRKSDPVTSFLAAESVNGVTELQSRILALFAEHGAMTDEEMIQKYQAQYGPWWPATDSSLRTRRSDLHHKDLLVEQGTKLNSRGRKSISWNLADGRLF